MCYICMYQITSAFQTDVDNRQNIYLDDKSHIYISTLSRVEWKCNMLRTFLTYFVFKNQTLQRCTFGFFVCFSNHLFVFCVSEMLF